MTGLANGTAYTFTVKATNAAGEKLSKQTLATAIDTPPAAHDLPAALGFLGKDPPAALGPAPTRQVWAVGLHPLPLRAVPRRVEGDDSYLDGGLGRQSR